MNKNMKKTLLPALRFPEFQDAGEWGQVKLRELAKRIAVKNKGSKIIRVLTNSAADGVVDQRDYFDKDIANQNNLEGYFIVDNGDYVYNPRVSNLAPVGPISKNRLGTGVMSPLYSVFRFKSSDNDFYEQYFKAPRWHHYLRMISNSGARHDRMSITNDDLMDMPLPAPCIKEQQKIAECLSSIDALICAQNQKIEALKNHKKGLLQQLFPREGESFPSLRFPEFKNTGEWVACTLGQCLSRHPEYGINAPAVPYSENLPTYLRITDISDEGQIRNTQRVSVAKHVTDENYLKEGDIVLARTGASVGKAYKYKGQDGKLVFAGFLIRVRPNEKKLISELLFQFFSTDKYWRWVDFSSARSGQPGINGNEYASLPVQLPPTLNEQQKIADCLSSIDAVLAANSKKLGVLEAHKKGLTQAFFPDVCEVSYE